MSNIIRIARYLTYRYDELAEYYDNLEDAVRNEDQLAAVDALKDIDRWCRNSKVEGKLEKIRQAAREFSIKKKTFTDSQAKYQQRVARFDLY